ncbi:hypothetical protein ACODM8_03555 [Vibrio ostreicida]|uniref:hypothetical protein n=1 Tax=Vibrio ostreicida TaxID=526588 RepID=UPI003B5B43EA
MHTSPNRGACLYFFNLPDVAIKTGINICGRFPAMGLGLQVLGGLNLENEVHFSINPSWCRCLMSEIIGEVDAILCLITLKANRASTRIDFTWYQYVKTVFN